MTRKPPVRHTVKKHYRQGTLVESFKRGSGAQRTKHHRVVGSKNPKQRGYRPYLDVRRRWNDIDIYWIEEKKLFGKPLYAVKKAYWAKSVMQTTDRKKAEKYRDTKNADIYLRSRLGDRKYLIGVAERVGLIEDELEGFSNASVMGEIMGSDEFQNVMRELATKVSEE